MLTETLHRAAVDLGRRLGTRVPLGLAEVAVRETVARAATVAAPRIVADAGPPRARTWWWWIGYGGAWVVAFGATLSLAERPGFPVPLAAGPIAFAALLALAAGVLAIVQRWVRESHAERAALLARAVVAVATRAGVDEAVLPGRSEPVWPLPVAWPRPGPQPYGVSHRGAELLVADWMRHLGATDAEATRFTGDGGVDVASAHWIAQVKNLAERTTVPVAQVRELAGVAAHDGRRALFFTSGAYSPGGVAFADRAGLALFEYHAEGGALRAANAHARLMVTEGLRPPA
ncbi:MULTISPECIES: restriction endonuclease [unclassified Agromyces]|uniref:restriction endonuclease n=1 Tax=unclassified Agromyces TaxID=2639701 RepID=UPI0030156985